MTKKVLALCSVILLLYACQTEEPTLLPEGVIESDKPFYVINDIVQLRLESSSELASVQWDFGNGTSSKTEIGQVQYLEPGIYEVNLTLTDLDGISNVISKEIIVGQYHGYEAVLHEVSAGYSGESGNVQLRLSNSDFLFEEAFWVSPIIEDFQFVDLPLAIEIDVPLGDARYHKHERPFFKFMETETETILGGEGSSTSYTWLENEFEISGLGRYSIKYKLVLPE